MNSLLANLPWVKQQTDLERLLERPHVPKQMEFGSLWAEETHTIIDQANELSSKDGGKLERLTHWFRAGL